MTEEPDDRYGDDDRRFSGATAILIIGVGVTGMGAFLLVQQITGGPLVWDKSHGVYLSRRHAVELAMAMIVAGAVMWWLGLRWTDRTLP